MNLDGRIFKSVSNSGTGEVDGSTTFRYRQEGKNIRAEYAGGRIVRGYLMGAHLGGLRFEIRYLHLNTDGQVKTGICQSQVSVLADGKYRITEKWKWTCDDHSEGESEIAEI